jgi:glutamine phosphoribosylpyrophosphate amidotransferase
MCGVIGVSLSTVGADDIELIRRTFLQTMIRGKHATGLSYVKGGVLTTIKRGEPVTQFLKQLDFSDFINEDGGLYMIGHIRYSTSDIHFNQPFSNDSISIAHNGVLSQDEPENWKYKCETANDSEMILKSYEAGKNPLQDFMQESMAVVTITSDKKLSCYRNHERPLWYTELDNGIIFTSTKDIAIRSGLNKPLKCEMFTEYNYDGKTLETIQVDFNTDIEDLQ